MIENKKNLIPLWNEFPFSYYLYLWNENIKSGSSYIILNINKTPKSTKLLLCKNSLIIIKDKYYWYLLYSNINVGWLLLLVINWSHAI